MVDECRENVIYGAIGCASLRGRVLAEAIQHEQSGGWHPAMVFVFSFAVEVGIRLVISVLG